MEGQQHGDRLKRGLKNRHIQLIALGGAIGTGLFLGSASVIQSAGPGIILGYAIAGLFHFEQAQYFEADDASRQVPQVQF